MKWAIILAVCATTSTWAVQEDLAVVRGLTGQPGGRLIYAQRTEPKTLNPLIATDAYSREVIPRLMADLIHINRYTQLTEPALAKSWKLSQDGRHFTLELRRGIRFSDGAPFTADDVVFTFESYLDEKIQSPQRDQLIQDGKPIVVRKLDTYRVAFDLPTANAVAERLFDGFYILPRHLLAKARAEGRLKEAMGFQMPLFGFASLGPFRLAQYMPGRQLVLERNPYYWKSDEAGHRLPYLDQLVFVFAGTEDTQVLRFQSGESDILNRPSAKNFAVLQRDAERHGLKLYDLGPGMEYNFLLFNLNPPARLPASVAPHRAFLQSRAFRAAVSAAIDRDAIVRLVYLNHATPLAGLVPPGNKPWVNATLPKPVRDLNLARTLLRGENFRWDGSGALLDPTGARVQFTIAVSSSNAERQQMATLIQEDLKELGISVNVAPLEFRSLLDRVQRTFDYDACVLGLASADADPNVDLNVWLSNGATHLWNPQQPSPGTAWEAEIDRLMHEQAVTRAYPARKKLFDRVQQILAEQLPMVPLVSPNILAGAKQSLGNFRPAVLDHTTLWNVEELCWRTAGGVRK